MKLPFLCLSVFQNSLLFYLFYSQPTAAQIIPDRTLPINSQVTQQGNTYLIEDGTPAGTNLFHSFESFSIPTGGIAFFNNGTDIQNIFSRVTGSSLSNIDGLIRANPPANLFLINPNGLIFGPNAKLEIGGSFFGGTAESIWFADGLEFSARNPQTTPLLSIHVPLGLQYGTNPGRIVVQGPGHHLSQQQQPPGDIIRDNRPDGLRVNDGQTLALVGGEVRLQGGNLTAEGGRIEVGSVDSNSYVTLTHPGWMLGYGMIQNFQDIALAQAASVDVSGAASGTIQAQGRRLTLRDGSTFLALKTGGDSAGSITVKASELVEAIGITPTGNTIPSGLLTVVSSTGTGIGGNIMIETGRLILQEGAQIAAGTRGDGQGGTLTVKAAESIDISGTQPNPRFTTGLFTNVQPGVRGDGGDLIIETGRLIVRDGGVIAAGTFSDGNSGNLMIKASELMEVSGFAPKSLSVSGVVTDVRSPNATGNAGNLTIETRRLIVRDGAVVSVNTFGGGNSGNLMVRASESVELRGIRPNTRSSSGLLAGVVREDVQGGAGNITVETGRLMIRDGATITASSENLQPAGTLKITADSINLDTFGSISADTQAGGGSIELRSPTLTLNNSRITTNATGGDSGGNINVEGQLLFLQNGSTITTNAFLSNATGGNINLNLDQGFLVGLENSDITANAEQSRGGNIAINAVGIFGVRTRTREQLQRLLNTEDAAALDPRQVLTSDITAISQQGGPQLEGVVSINTPDLDPSSGLLELPVDVVDPTQLIARGCPTMRDNSFTVTGRGGLPPLPSETLRPNNTISVDWVTSDRSNQPKKISSPPITQVQIVEATGWMVNEKNEIVLIASIPATTLNNFLPIPESCLTEE